MSSIFNKNERSKNVMKSTMIGEIYTIVNLLLGFAYRSAFLHFLSVEYLGINGLFTQMLNLLGMADLGITNAIVFRFYKPIKEDDYTQVGRLMNYFKRVYRIIFTVIMSVGLIMLPFINIIIKDASEIPADVNIYVAYLLFLFQTASSYLFAYRQSLLTADQRKYIVFGAQTVITVLRYIMQFIILSLTRNYILTLVLNILTNVIGNYLISLYAVHRYKPIFKIAENLPQKERKEILNDTKACLSHKIGSVVLKSTDSLILSRYEGLIAVGVYSNYTMIINNLQTLVNQMLSNTTASLGNIHASYDENARYRVYRNLMFVNLWFVSTITICLYVLINPFIALWVGEALTLNSLSVIMICAQFFLELSRVINMSYTSASGLFTKDIIRPYIEAGLNLFFSIVTVQIIGIAGVFLGTCISCILTVTWREPYLLFKYEFKRSMKEYWFTYISFVFLTITLSSVLKLIVAPYITNFPLWIVSGVFIVIVSQIIIFIIFWKREERHYLYGIAKRLFIKK